MEEIAISSTGRHISRRAYFALMGLLIFAGFAFIAFTYWLCTYTTLLDGLKLAEGGIAFSVATIVLPIVGIIVACVGKGKKSLPLSVVGYVLVVGSLGFVTGLVLPLFELSSIIGAFIGTVVVSAVFTVLGTAFPGFFAKVYRILFAVLIGAILATLVCFVFNLTMVWYSWAVLVIFTCFIAHDTYRAAHDEPTVENAIWHAVDIWIDLINVLMSLLDILDD